MSCQHTVLGADWLRLLSVKLRMVPSTYFVHPQANKKGLCNAGCWLHLQPHSVSECRRERRGKFNLSVGGDEGMFLLAHSSVHAVATLQ